MAGPFIGPKGGKWSDAKHTVPVVKRAKKKVKKSTLYVVPARRAGVDGLLEKAFSRGPRPGVKYIKKTPYFSGGKMKWRYYYRDDNTRTEGRAHHDPHEEHDHHLVAELKTHHENLRGKVRSALETTMTFLRGLFGFKKQPEVSAGSTFQQKYIDPTIAKEREGGAPDPNAPTVKVAKALDMIPDVFKEMVDPAAIEKVEKQTYKGLKSFELLTNGEDPYLAGRLTGLFVGGHANPHKGSLVINSLSFDLGKKGITSVPEFNCPETMTEEVVWHEFGHHVHFRIEEDVRRGDPKWKDAWAKWTSGLAGKRITAYAHTNPYEDFAEAFACMISHPKQLARMCGERYDWMQEHLFEHLPERDEMLGVDDAELAWWEDKPHTKVTEALIQARKREGSAAPFHPMHSERDQFYTVSYMGRTLHLRYGPPDKESEGNWEAMPETTYEETVDGADGQPVTVRLPRNENLVGARFKSSVALKEIYDEAGRALTDHQAFLHLSQDEEGLIAKMPEDIEVYGKAADKKTKQEIYSPDERHKLSRLLFESLGFKDKHTQEYERSRLTKIVAAQKKYDEAVKKRDSGKKLTAAEDRVLEKGRPDFSWDLKAGKPMKRIQIAPHEISRHEFMQVSGTFAFGDMKPSPRIAPWLALNEDGTVQKKADGSSVTTATVYEQENPDGSWTKIPVSTSAPFARGDTIRVPGPSGTRSLRLTAGQSLDPFQIARDHNTTAKRLLEMNGKFGRGQIMDPIMSSLINPGGIPITDATKLQELMREAASHYDQDPETKVPYVGRRAWVTIAGAPGGGATQGNRATAHIQVQFDGSGPPLVVGPYWERKLGKSPLRVDELLNRHDEVTTPTILERKPKKMSATPGNLVWFTDPKTDRRVLGSYVEKKKDKKTGKSLFMVQPLASQVAGQSTRLVGVKKIAGVSEDLVPGSPGLRKRIVDPLPNDLLLYMDEVPRGSGAEETKGMIRVLLPKDGSVTLAEIEKYPGVRVLDPLPGEILKRITISAADIPEFRARSGGFMMGPRVLAKIREEDTRSRVLAEQSGKKQIVQPEELEGPDGNINPDGLLKGLVEGDDGIQPGEHRIRALQKLAKNNGRLYAAHFMGTGKTALAVMAAQMMRNLKDPGDDTKPHAKRVQKKVLHVVPLNTADNWFQEYVRFLGAPTVVGAQTLSGAQQLPKLPKRSERESDNAFRQRVLSFWKEAVKNNPRLWNPWADSTDNVVIPMEYFRDNEEALRLTNMFDGLVVDEAHKVARENQISRAIERWNPQMNMFLLLSGTPITNNLRVLPRIVDLVTAGEVKLGSEEEFSERYLVASQVLQAFGKKGGAKTDLNPQRVGELMSILQPLMDVATTADVKGKSMPAVLLDENEPAHMTGQQGRMYRAAMAALTEAERDALGASGALGLDEGALLSEDARRKIQVARSIANAPSYKAPDDREAATFEAVVAVRDRHGRTRETTQVQTFELPSLGLMTSKKKGVGWRGKWPNLDDVEAGRVNRGYYDALHQYIERVLGVGYEYLEGKKIEDTPAGKKLLSALRKKGEFTTLTGETWNKGTGMSGGGRLLNPDYGPEGMICRGKVDEVTGEITKLDKIGKKQATYFDSQTGKWLPVEVEPGHLFVRDPRSKAMGIFYDNEDWDFTGRFSDKGEDGQAPGGAEGEEGGPQIPDIDTMSRKQMEKLAKKHSIELPDDLDDDEYRALLEDALRKTVLGKKGNQQGPKAGAEGMTIQRHPARRKQRAMFDMSVTENNAKCDKLEEIMREALKEKTGDGASAQMIIFGNRIGSSVRTAEAKLRTMGYMDVNEALGHPDISSDHDKKRGMETRKFFATYMGKGATLGDRDINSEIYRRVQDDFGTDTGVSLFVQRTMYGTSKDKYLKIGEMSEPWGRTQRKRIQQAFVDGSGKAARNGQPLGMEVPMRVLGWRNDDGSTGTRYVYESEVTAPVRAQVKALEVEMRAQRGEKKEATRRKVYDLLKSFATERPPLTEAQQDIFNNCQIMVASDAANVGLNWPSKHLIMYDSLFSPMEEWQRITRSARMLPPAVRGPAKAYIEKVGAHIEKLEKENDFKEYEGIDSAMLIVRSAIEDALTPAEREELNDLPGGAPDQIMEAWFAKRAFDKIASLREEVGATLRSRGDIPDPGRAESYIPPEAITEADVMNHIIRKKLTPFDVEILKSRRYLVDVKRLTVSVDMPEFVTVRVTDPYTGKKRKRKVATGKMEVESPAMAEKSQLAQGRAKMVPYEFFLKAVQNEMPKHTRFDYVPAGRGSLAMTSLLSDSDGNPVKYEPDEVAPQTKKSMPSFYIPRRH